jgi:hypothetical protein
MVYSFSHQHQHEVAVNVNYPIALDWMLWSGVVFFAVLTLLALFVFGSYMYYTITVGWNCSPGGRKKSEGQQHCIKQATIPVVDRK